MRNDLVNLLRPYTIFDKKIRLGSQNDGGYVLNETLLIETDNYDDVKPILKLTNN